MITDRELDVQLAGAAGVHDVDLPALPENFLALLTGGTDGVTTAHATQNEPASVTAARQLVADAHDARTGTRPRRRRASRKALVRVGTAVVAVAAAWTTAVVVAPADRTAPPDATPTPTIGTETPGSIEPPANGIALVAAEQVTFPLSLDPAPAGLTPTFSRFGGRTPFGETPVGFSADYRSADGVGFTLWTTPGDPREMPETGLQQEYARYDVAETGTTTVGGTAAAFVRGDYGEPHCTSAPATPQQTKPPGEVCLESFTDLFWQREPGQWVWIRGEDAYGSTAAVVAVAESLTDRPQPAQLQVQLAPAGWSLSGYENSRTMTVTSDADPDQWMNVSLVERWSGRTLENAFDGMELKSPVEEVTVNGQPARLVVGDGAPWPHDFWYLVGRLGGGVLFQLQVPATFTEQQVLEIAEQVAYTP